MDQQTAGNSPTATLSNSFLPLGGVHIRRSGPQRTDSERLAVNLAGVAAGPLGARLHADAIRVQLEVDINVHLDLDVEDDVNDLFIDPGSPRDLKWNPDVSIEVGRSEKEHYWRLVKGRDGKLDIGGTFKIDAVTFQTDPEQEPLESVVVRHLGAEESSPALRLSPRVTKAQERADRALAAICERLQSERPRGGQSAATTGLSLGDARSVVSATFQDYASKHRAQYVREALESLVASGRLERDGDTLRLPA